MNNYTRILIERPDAKSKTTLTLYRGDSIKLVTEFSSLHAAMDRADYYNRWWPDLHVTVNLTRHTKEA